MREQSRRCGDERNAVPQTQKFGMVHDKAHRLCESRHARACDEKEVGSAHRCDRRSSRLPKRIKSRFSTWVCGRPAGHHSS